MSDGQRRADTEHAVDGLRRDAPELATLFDAIRAEFDAKVSALKAWGFAMCLGAGFLGGLTTTFTELVRPGSVGQALGFLPWV